jgi:tRNA threonylcarbamoyl adenosine modification protein YeaZ
MRVVAIDTADRQRITAVLVDDAGLRDSRVLRDTPVDRGLPVALAELDLGQLTAVVVVTGPGSHTGIRAGMAAALGMAQARGLPLYSVGALEVVAHGSPVQSGAVVAVADAGRGGLFAGEYRRTAGDELVEVTPPARLQTAGYRVSEGALVVALDRCPPGLQGTVTVEPADVALGRAVRVALRRPPVGLLDIASLATTS